MLFKYDAQHMRVIKPPLSDSTGPVALHYGVRMRQHLEHPLSSHETPMCGKHGELVFGMACKPNPYHLFPITLALFLRVVPPSTCVSAHA